MPELRVRRDDLSSCELAAGEPARDDLAEGEAQLLVERFALSANNITYGVFGDQLGYWHLFPAPEGWGRIPAWGYARVVASRAPGVTEGQRVLGLVPMGTYLTVRPVPHPIGFMDTAAHRAELSPVYNQYLSVEGEGDDAALVMRPLFGTSVLLDLLLEDAGFEGARTVVLDERVEQDRVRTRAPASRAPRGHDRADLGPAAGVARGPRALRRGPHLRRARRARRARTARCWSTSRATARSCAACTSGSVTPSGARSSSASPTARRRRDEAPLPGPEPQFFFAPDEIVRRGRELGLRYAQAWRDFAPVAERTMRIERVTDGDELVRVYRTLLEGRADPAVGYVVSL